MKCSDVEAAKETERPEMNLYRDLSVQDADYYAASSSTKSKVLTRYLDATGNTNAMPDMCYEKCKSAVDAVVKGDTTDICEGAALANALVCLEETGMTACSSSVFSNDHAGECDSNNTVRTLEESEDAMELLVNETPQTAAVTRTFFYGKCPKVDGRPGAYMVFPTQYGLAECVRFDFDLKKGSFILEIGWMRIATHFAFWMKLQFCIDLATLFGIGPRLYAEISTSSPCPQVRGIFISGSAWFSLEIGFGLLDLQDRFRKHHPVSRPVSVGQPSPHNNDGWRRRRRWWTRRRRNWRRCNYRTDCDLCQGIH